MKKNCFTYHVERQYLMFHIYDIGYIVGIKFPCTHCGALDRREPKTWLWARAWNAGR